VPSLIVYATRLDADLIRTWINEESCVAWITKVREENHHYEWKAVRELDSIQQQEYALWHMESGHLNIPSGNARRPDAIVHDPFRGWVQNLEHSGKTCPWFGGNLPGPYSFVFAEDGCEAPGNLARSEFNWLGDRYKSIGKPADPVAWKWWRRLQRFVRRSTTAIPWVESLTNRRVAPMAYAFPDAARQIQNGRQRDVNPWNPRNAA